MKIPIHVCEFLELYKFKQRDRVYLSVTNSDGSHCQILLARKQNYDETGLKWIIQYIIKCSVYLSYIPSSSQIEENTIIPQQLNIGVWYKLELFSEANLDLYYFNRYH